VPRRPVEWADYSRRPGCSDRNSRSHFSALHSTLGKKWLSPTFHSRARATRIAQAWHDATILHSIKMDRQRSKRETSRGVEADQRSQSDSAGDDRGRGWRWIRWPAQRLTSSAAMSLKEIKLLQAYRLPSSPQGRSCARVFNKLTVVLVHGNNRR
jgi:hypothetical protein